MAYNVSYIFQAMDKFSPQVARMSSAVNNFNADIGRTAGKVKNHFSKMESIAASAAIGMTAALPVKSALEFDRHMTSVRKQVSGLDTPEALKDMEKFIKTSGVKFGMAANDMADLVAEGAKSGVLKEDMADYVRVVGSLSNAFDMSAGAASEMTGSIQARLGMNIGEIDKFTDYVNYLDDQTNASGANMLDIINRTSGVMKTIHMPPNLIAGFAAFADRIETSPELAASGFSMMIGKMQEIPSINKELLKGDPEATIRKVLGGLAEMPEVERSGKIVEMFGLNAKHFVEKAVTSLKLYDETMGLAKDSTSALGSKQREMEARAKSAAFQFQQMKVQIENISITIGAAFLPIIKQLAPIVADISARFSAFAETHSRFLKFVVIFGLILGAVAAVAGVVAVLVMAFGGLGAAIASGLVVVSAYLVTMWSEGENAFTAFYNGIISSVGYVANQIIGFINLIVSGWNMIINALGIDIQIPLMPQIEAIESAFSGMIDNLLAGWNKITGIFGGGITAGAMSAAPALEQPVSGIGTASATAKASQQNVNVGGEIIVRAAPGAEVVSKKTEFNTGKNVAYGK